MTYLLPHTIDRAAARDGARDAFRVPNQGLSYADLVGRANQLAHHLVDAGVRRGDRVGILMPRCLESAIAVHGIMKAGAAFVPIDPHIPVGGLCQLISDCGIAHIVAHDIKARTLADLARSPPACLRTVIGPSAPPDAEGDIDGKADLPFTPWSATDSLPSGAGPDVAIMEDDLAYIMYSSGSTGRPKGLMHTHRSGLAYARLSVATYDVGPDDRIGNHSPLHFDMSTFGYFSGPYAGATTLLVPEAYTKMAASLSQLMASERLTIWYSVPLALIQLLARGVLSSRDLTSLRWVLFGGEPFARKHLRALMAQWPHARFSNVYGPAEVNQCTFHHLPPLGADAPDDAEPVPIGRVWDNTEGLVLDENDQEVEAGDVGELVIRSPTMMRGYWARPDLNARAFFHRAATHGLDETFYRTGDLVRTQADGDLLFLGRKDRQVKVRGYRIELDDLELTLGTHPAVEEAAVFPVRVAGVVEHLAAAVTLKPAPDSDAAISEATTPEMLRAFVAELVSWYAVPARIDIRTSLPRTTSGKIDRRALQNEVEQEQQDNQDAIA